MRDQILELLAAACGTDAVLHNPDMDLFADDTLDSLGMLTLLTLLEDEMNIEIQPTQIPHDAFRTPGTIVDLVRAWNGNPV